MSSTETPASPSPHRPRRLAWLAWVVVAAASAAGLRHYRVDNTLDDWTPGHRPLGELRSYVVIGWDDPRIDGATLARRLRGAPSVALCIDRDVLAAWRLLGGPTPEDFVVGRDGRYAGVFCFAKPQATDQAFVAEIGGILAERAFKDTRFDVAGPATYHLLLNEYAQRHMDLVMGLILVVGFLTIAWSAGRWRTAAAGVGAIMLALVTLLGTVSWMRIPVDMSVSMIPPLMMALGFSYVLHLAVHPSRLRVLVLCVLTTGAGFASSAFTALVPIQRFSLLGCLGLLLVWLAVVTLITPRPDRRQRGSRPWLGTLRAAVVWITTRRPGTIIAVSAALTVAAIVFAHRVRFQTDPLSYFPPAAVEPFHTLDRRLTGMLPFQVVLDRDLDMRPVLEQTPGVRKAVRLPANATGVSEAVWWCLADNEALPHLTAARPAWQRWAKERGARLAWRGVAAQLAETHAVVWNVAVWTLPSMALLDGLVIWLISRRLRWAAMAAWVCLMPTAALLLAVALLRVPLDIPVLMVGAIATGLAVDDTLHLVSEARRTGSARRAVLRCWQPCVGSSLSGSLTLLPFALSPFAPTRAFGLMLAAATLAAMLANQLLLPALLARRP